MRGRADFAGRRYDIALVIGVAAPAIIFLLVYLLKSLPHANQILDGKEFIEDGAAKTANYIRNFFELFNFVAGVVVALVAWIAISFARQQAIEAGNSRKEAENTRITNIYITIVDRWNSPELVSARFRLFGLKDEFKLEKAKGGHRDFVSEYDYITAELLRLKNTSSRKELRSYIVLLQFFEDIGLLCRKTYMKEADVFDLIGSPIENCLKYFHGYIKHARSQEDGNVSSTTYANAIYLYKQAIASKRLKHEEDLWEQGP